MSKKKIYYSESERLYVEEQMTVEEISSRINVSVRTLKSWKKENNWTVKRKEFLESKQRYHQASYLYARKLFKNLKEDCNMGRKISGRRLHSMENLIDTAVRLQKAELKENEIRKYFKTQEKRTSLTPEEVRDIQRRFLGME